MRKQSRKPDGVSGPNKRATLMEYLLKKRELDNSSKPNQTSAKGSPPEKNSIIKKELLTLTPSNHCRWEKLKLMMMVMSENQSSQSQVHVTAFWVLRVKCQKASLNTVNDRISYTFSS
jgi:hypothetical protein